MELQLTVRARERLPERAAWLVLLLAVPLLLLLPVSNDSAWQMWLGRQMLHGASLYTDLGEVNPPLWFWLAIPLAALAEALALPPRIVLLGFFLLALAASLALSIRLARGWPASRRAMLYAAMGGAAILAALPIFTQREHFALVTAIPYVLLCARRERGEPVSAVLAATVGLFAAFGFALKPFFVLAPLALELWLWRRTPLIRAETVVLGGCACLYAAALLLFEADYLDALRPIAAAYPYFTAGTWAGYVAPVLILCLAAIPLARAEGAAAAFLVAALAFFLAYLVQGKGWGYQALPAKGALLIALALVPHGRSIIRDSLAIAAAIAVIVPNLRLFDPDERLADAIAAPPGAVVAVLSPSMRPLWPAIEDRGWRWPLRGPALWTLPAITDGGRSDFAPALRREVADDLLCNPPDYLAVDTRGIDLVAFLSAEPRFGELLAAYRPQYRVAGFAVMRRVGPPPAPLLDCRVVR